MMNVRREDALRWADRALGILVAVDLTVMVGCALLVMLGRIGFPHDLEWMTGAILDHVERVQRGQPLYTAPSVGWIPFLYPPLYYWVCAQVARVASLRVAARSVSLASTLVQAILVGRTTRRLGGSRTWAFVAVGLFFTAYPFLEFWFDIERPDSLFMALLLGGYVVLAESRETLGALVAGALVGLSFFAKQPALLFVAAGTAALLVERAWARAAAFLGAAALVLVPLAAHLESASGGWFSYYVWHMPQAHGISLVLLPVLLADLGRAWLYILGTLAAPLLLLLRPREQRVELTTFLAFLLAALAASASSRLHVGGWPNVLMFWIDFACIAVAALGAQLPARSAASIAGSLALLVQAGQFAYWPFDRIPTPGAGERDDELAAHVRQLEANGEVLVMGRGHVTTPRHFHDAAFYDVLYVEKRVPEAIMTAVRSRSLAAIVVDNFDDVWLPYEPAVGDSFFRVLAANYYVAERLDERLPNCVLGFPVHPSWVFARRDHPLDEHGPIEPLLRQHLAEIAAAHAAQEAARRGVVREPGAPSTEQVARDFVRDLAFPAPLPPPAPPPSPSAPASP